MTKKLTDLESQAPLTSLKWKGHPLNNSDVGYDSEWDYVVPESTTGPFNPIEEKED